MSFAPRAGRTCETTPAREDTDDADEKPHRRDQPRDRPLDRPGSGHRVLRGRARIREADGRPLRRRLPLGRGLPGERHTGIALAPPRPGGPTSVETGITLT